MKKFSIFKESSEFKQVESRKLSAYEKHMVSKFIDFLSIVYKYTNKKAVKRTKQFYHFKEEVNPYLKYDFSKDVKSMLDRINDSIEYQIRNKERAEKDFSTFMSQHEQILDMLNAGDVSAAINLNTKNNRYDFIQRYLEVSKGTDHYANNMHNPFVKKWSFFSKESLVDDFSEEDVIKMIENKDKYLQSWTHISLPKNKLDDFEYIVYFIKELKEEHSVQKVKGSGVKNYIDYHYADNAMYQELKKLVENYLYGNHKDLIPKILNMINKLPLIREANEKAKKNISKLYRGLGWYNEDFENLTKEDIWKQEQEAKYVATSKSHHSAKNFEYSKGHLDSGRNSDVGVMIVYKPKPSDIILDTEIFGSIFGESEVIINTKTITKPKITFSYK